MSYGKLVRQVGAATLIPMVLIAGPLVGYWMGGQIDKRFGTNPWGIGILSVLGFAAGIKQVVQIIQRLIQESKEEDSKD